MKGASLGDTDVGKLAAMGGVHLVSVHQLHLHIHAVVDQGIDGIFKQLRRSVDTALLLDPIPAGVVGAVFVLADANPFKSSIEHTRPPPAVPGEIRITRHIGVDAEAVFDLRRALGRNFLGELLHLGRCWSLKREKAYAEQ